MFLLSKTPNNAFTKLYSQIYFVTAYYQPYPIKLTAQIKKLKRNSKNYFS